MSVATWIAASRPKTLPAAIVPVVVGTACAYAVGAIAWAPALAALAGAIAIQIGTNFANDVFDAEKGADTAERVGPLRAVSAGLISAGAMKRAMILAFAVACAFGAYLVSVGGWPIAVIGLASVASGIAYTGGPFPFGYYGLGELFVFLFFGLAAVCGTYFVQVHTLTPAAVVAAAGVGALVTAILVVNNYRDLETDRRAGKRTLAVRLGRKGTQIEYAALFVLAYAVPLLLWLAFGYAFLTLLAWLTAPLALRLVRTLVAATDGPTLNKTLAGTARLGLVYGVLLRVGIVASLCV